MIYLETGAYEKAAMAFRQAIALEGDVPSRHIALAKAEEKMGNTKKAIEALESSFELDPKVSTLRQILAIYEDNGDTEAATATAARIEEQITKDNAAKKRRVSKAIEKRPLSSARATIKNTKRAQRTSSNAATKNAQQKGLAVHKTVPASKTKQNRRTIKSHIGRKRI